MNFENPQEKEEKRIIEDESFDRFTGSFDYQQAEKFWRDEVNNEEDLEINSSFVNQKKEIKSSKVEKKKTKEKEKKIEENKMFSQQESEQLIGDIFKRIEANLDDQPESVQKIYQERKNEFKTFAKIKGVDFLFCDKSSDEILSLVRDNENKEKWKTRVFRFSKSDNQWKVLPGMRDDGYHFMKGEEDNPLHHYVQSAKLHKDMYKVISSLPESSVRNNNEECVPVEKGRFNNELELKEKYLELKNEKWRNYQNGAQSFFGAFNFFNNSKKQLGLESEWYKICKKTGKSNKHYKKIAESVEFLFNNSLAEKEINDINEKRPGFFFDLSRFSKDDYPEHYKEFLNKYQEAVGELFEWGFSYPIPETMIPDFSENKIIDSYKKGKISIEEYEVKSPEGDHLVFAMAHDEKGRVYIDNIYDPSIKMNDYGIPSEICQMGHLVYKPEDYDSQVFGIPEKYQKPTSSYQYVDISALWENISIVKNFKEELARRGVL
ncbi:MAG: hypothetical protein XD75_0028 [Parcubacteria bacterium 33_209]|nr:MAG: hypothetical protein XD75_0028 [Parcubacteria bacterium 33_209]